MARIRNWVTGSPRVQARSCKITLGQDSRLREWVSLDGPAVKAWRAYDNAAELAVRVNPAVPILFFGDLAAYRVSTLRVVTVGLNPSRQEFPANRPFSRFPSADGPMGREPDRYLAALSSYYRTDPYRAWFSAFEPLLNGAGASYYPGHASTSLHTDICSPVATDPTWSKLSDADQSTLASDGGPLWHMLLEALKPQIVVMSVARRHVERIGFEPLDDKWSVIHTLCQTKSGAPRSRPYEVQARWYDVGGCPSLFVRGPAAQTPFGLIPDSQKHKVGKIMSGVYQDVR